MAVYRRYWNVTPPADALIAAYLGYKPREVGTIEDLAAFMGVDLPDG